MYPFFSVFAYLIFFIHTYTFIQHNLAEIPRHQDIFTTYLQFINLHLDKKENEVCRIKIQ